MTTRTRIAAFAVVLGASFGAGALAGASLDPLRQGEPAHPHASPGPPGTGVQPAVTAPEAVDGGHGAPAPDAPPGPP